MASRIWVLHCRGFLLSPPCASSQYRRISTGSGAASWKGRFSQFLSSYFTGVKEFSLQMKNGPYTKTRQQFGNDFAAAVFAVELKGKIKNTTKVLIKPSAGLQTAELNLPGISVTFCTYRVVVAATNHTKPNTLLQEGEIFGFQGQEEWFSRRSWQFDPALCIEAVDVHGSVINYDGLRNLVVLDNLRYLNLSQCPYIDDWCLNQLYNLAGSLEELSLAGCHQVTEKGLACLHHLENLRRLDVSDLPGVPEKGLVGILLEEMLPQCDIVGMKIWTLDMLDLDPNGKALRGMEDQAASWR